jgi:hypothetical protein
MNSAKIVLTGTKFNRVSQGSILSPLFFLLYINNLPHIISNISRPTLFADNTRVILLALIPLAMPQNL